MAETASCLPADEFAFQQSSPHSLRDPFSSPPAAPLNVNPIQISDTTPPSPEAEQDLAVDTDQTLEDRRISTVSSISSFPASVVHHEPPGELRTPSRSPRPQSIRYDSVGSFGDVATSPRRRGYAAAFRNPSSVRAMQMKDELEDDSENLTPHRRSGSHYSVRSHGSAYSAHTSPAKRVSRSSQSSPLKKSSNLKKEFPLVLLHCTLLPPANGLLSPHVDNELFGALLPEEYRKRWAALQDRVAMAEVKARGILIPHPQEDYELLEERLLESLELERPRIRSNHFIHRDGAGADSGFESASQTDDENDDKLPHDITCPDCGKGIGLRSDKSWEIKVYAANGLMRAGAWSAAWREMEKVDVEIGLWMPEDVRHEVNARLEALLASEHDAGLEQLPFEVDYDSSRRREIYGTERHVNQHSPDASREPEEIPSSRESSHFKPQVRTVGVEQSLDLGIAALFQDRKNLLIILLSVVMIYVITSANNGKATLIPTSEGEQKVPEVATTTVTSTAIFSGTATLSNELSTTTALDFVSVESEPEESSLGHSALQTELHYSPDATPVEVLEQAQPPSSAEEYLRDQDERQA